MAERTSRVVERDSAAPSSAGSNAAPLLEVEGLVKVYDRTNRYAVDHVSFSVNRGELVSLLGPSGCGKTTTLRMIAGFETLDAGDIRVNGKSIARLAPRRRPVGFVFQQYSLFPHMTVAENVAFGLKATRVPKAQILEKVNEALRVVRLSGYENRAITMLSGGEQQRVAMARVLVTEPELILLDEPFGALDRKLRDELQTELKELLERLSMTAIFVTHDQDEALLMSNRVVVMRGGRIEQMGTPSEVYERPASTFVASFVGTSNRFDGPTAEGPHGFVVSSGIGAIHGSGDLLTGGNSTLVIRPEKVVLSSTPLDGENCFAGRVASLTYTGNQSGLQVTLDSGEEVMARQLNTGDEQRLAEGDRVWVRFPPEHVVPVAVSE